MKQLSSIVCKLYSVIAVIVLGLSLSSCSFMEDVVVGMAQGMNNYPMYGMASSYNTGYSSTTSSSSTHTSSHKTCSRCRGTANCQTCDGTGKKYDYGTKSLVTHEKYIQRCGVCNGTGRCGVCDGKGSI